MKDFYEVLGYLWLFLYPASIIFSIVILLRDTLKKKSSTSLKLMVFFSKVYLIQIALLFFVYMCWLFIRVEGVNFSAPGVITFMGKIPFYFLYFFLWAFFLTIFCFVLSVIITTLYYFWNKFW